MLVQSKLPGPEGNYKQVNSEGRSWKAKAAEQELEMQEVQERQHEKITEAEVADQ
jgi:hypothetical protein